MARGGKEGTRVNTNGEFWVTFFAASWLGRPHVLRSGMRWFRSVLEMKSGFYV